jgi:predicted DNA-binding transcriptional regulator AlpA
MRETESKPDERSLAMTFQVNEAILTLLCQKIGEVIRPIIAQEIQLAMGSVSPHKATAPSQPTSPDPISSGLDLPLEERTKAATAKEDIKAKSFERQGLIDSKGLAQMFSIAPRTLWRLQSEKAIPEPIRLGKRVLWREVEILAWMDEGCPAGGKWHLIRKRAIRDYEMARRTR